MTERGGPDSGTLNRSRGYPIQQSLTHLARDLGEQVARARQDHELAVADDHLHDVARLRRKDLVVGAVQQQQWRVAELVGVLAPGGLRRERDDAAAVASRG